MNDSPTPKHPLFSLYEKDVARWVDSKGWGDATASDAINLLSGMSTAVSLKRIADTLEANAGLAGMISNDLERIGDETKRTADALASLFDRIVIPGNRGEPTFGPRIDYKDGDITPPGPMRVRYRDQEPYPGFDWHEYREGKTTDWSRVEAYWLEIE